MILEDQYKNAMEEKIEKENAVKRVRPPTAQQKKDQHKIKLLENQLEKQTVFYNNIVSGNKKLQQEVDVLRKEMRTALKVHRSLKKDINSAMDSALKLNTTTYQGKRTAEETNNHILALKAKHEAEKQNFERKIKDLQEKLKEKDETNEMERSHYKEASPKKGSQGGGAQEFANPAAILKQRLQKWVVNNKEKKQLMDKYVRNVKIIEDAFDQIKEATGISSTEEIVTTFIKAEEQNYSLYNYVNKLNTDIDTIEEQNKVIASEIKKHEIKSNMTEQEKQKLMEKLGEQTKETRETTKEKEDEITKIEEKLSAIQENTKRMVELFKQSRFMLSVAHNMTYDEGTVFNDKNVTQFLAELEEYISSLITYTAHKKAHPNAAIQAIPLEKIGMKEFERGPIAIDAPNSNDIMINEEVSAPEEERDVVNPKELYRKFQGMVDKNQISFSSNK